MAILNRVALSHVHRQAAGPSLSVYGPLGPPGKRPATSTGIWEALQSPTFVDPGMGYNRDEEWHELLAPVRGLLEHAAGWRHERGGIALFSAPGFFRYFLLPWRFPAHVVVGQRFHMVPLLPLLACDGVSWVLVLGANGVRLLQASEQLVREVEPQDLPVALGDSMQFDGRHRSWTFPCARGERPDLSQQLAAGRSPAKTRGSSRRRSRMLQAVDRSIQRLMGSRRRPLVLVGESPLVAAYRAKTRYPKVLVAPTATPDALSHRELHRLAWEATAPLMQRERAEAHARAGLHWAPTDEGQRLERLRRAADLGHVTDLFVRSRPASAFDWLEQVVLQTYLHGGRVYVARDDELPNGAVAAANVVASPAETRDRATQRQASPVASTPLSR